MSPKKEQEQRRAWRIFWWLIGLLGVSFALYIYAHYKLNQPDRPSGNISTDIQEVRGDITATREFLESPGEGVTGTVLRQRLEPIVGEIDRLLKSSEEPQQVLTDTRENLESLRQNFDGVNSLTPERQKEAIESLGEVERQLESALALETESVYFWRNPPLLWVEIAFWAWVGTILYLLSEIYTYYPDEEKQKFVEMTPWYFVTLIRGTFLVFILLLGLSNLQVGSAINFQIISVEVYIFLAGTFGYFNRVAKEQLKLLVKQFFPDAWTLANPDDPARSIPPGETPAPGNEGDDTSGNESPDGNGDRPADTPVPAGRNPHERTGEPVNGEGRVSEERSSEGKGFYPSILPEGNDGKGRLSS